MFINIYLWVNNMCTSYYTEEVNYGGVDSLEDRETNDRPLIATGSAGTSNNLSSARHFLVSTLDGKLTLLDQTGKEVWSLYTGELFSSTISSLQVVHMTQYA